MSLYDHELYMEDIRETSNADLPWEKLQDSTVMLSGATGLLGSFLVDVLMYKNEFGLNCTVYAFGRSKAKAYERFPNWDEDEHLIFVPCDVNMPLHYDHPEKVDFVLHLASNTHPLQYAIDPIGTITTNIIGLQNMLDFAETHHAVRFAFASSNEIYGENRGDTELFNETYCGYINCNTLRAGYPESKRCGEALCQAYKAQKGLDIVIPRFTRSYGPTMLMDDSKAISQFIRKGLVGEDIVLKSAGTQYYSYTYVADAVKGLLYVLLKGRSGEAYNIADEQSDIRLRDLASMIADISGTKVVFEVPDAAEASGYSIVTKARLDSRKLQKLGWSAECDIRSGLMRTIDILSKGINVDGFD